jgi:predicted nucleic acid-binding protein
MAVTGLTKFKRLLARHKHVGLDSMCFIYQFANHPAYSPLTSLIFEKMEKDDLAVTTSMISLIETLVIPERKKQSEVIAEYQKVFELVPNLNLLSIDYQVARLTAKLRASYPKIRIPDAIQLSAAILNECTIFITNDKQLAQVKPIKIALLSDYMEKQ